MDLEHLRASDGTGEAVLAHIDAPRNPGSTVLSLDNVDNWNSKAVIVTGTPAANGFIAAAGMKVMYGHITAGDFIIDGFAPGYADNGNTTQEIAIVKMTTSWADALVSILQQSLQNGGLLKTTSLDHFFKPVELNPSPFVASGGIIAITAGLTASFSNIIYYIGGLRYTKTGVANRAYTASKDTYVDIDAAGNLYYTEVANGATTGFPLTAGRIRLAQVITNGAGITTIRQVGFSDALGYTLYPVGAIATDNIQAKYRFQAYRNAAWNTNTGGAIVGLDAKSYDYGNNFNTATNRFVAPVAGLYRFNLSVGFVEGTTTQGMVLSIWVNGANRKTLINNQYNNPGGWTCQHSASCDLYLQAGDYVQMNFLGTPSTTGSTGIATSLEGYLVAAS